MGRKLTVLITLLITTSVYANESPQQLSFRNNEKLQLTLSPSAYNKVFINNEKITDFYFVKGDFIVADSNESGEFVPKDDGSIYLVPQTDKNPVIYLATNKGHHVALEVSIAHQSGQIIALVFNGKNPKPASTLVQKKSNVEDLIKAVAQQHLPSGFKGGAIEKAKAFKWDSEISLKMIRSYQNKNTYALVYLATNVSNKPIQVTPKGFSELGVKALSISEDRLNPGQSMYVYAIKEESNHA